MCQVKGNSTGDELQGFGNPVNHHDDDVNHGRFTKKAKKNSGGFQAMGLSFDVLKGITRRGYKIPTPIQRKVCINAMSSEYTLMFRLCFRQSH